VGPPGPCYRPACRRSDLRDRDRRGIGGQDDSGPADPVEGREDLGLDRFLLDDRFDDLVASLGGFYRTWYVVAGLELGLLARLRDAGADGLTAEELARRTGTEPALAGIKVIITTGHPGHPKLDELARSIRAYRIKIPGRARR